MSDRSAIEWTEATWNPVTGCTEVSPGCDRCYAKTFAERFRGVPGHHFENGFDVTLRPDKLDLPLRWKKPRRIFVNSMSDLFHKDIDDEYIAAVFAVMALAPQHTFQLLTKRHGRMRSLLNDPGFSVLLWAALVEHTESFDLPWPLPNVWLGVSVEDQQRADLRIPALLDTPAAVRWISAEPLLGPVDATAYMPWWRICAACNGAVSLDSLRPDLRERHARERHPVQARTTCLDWVVVGGESGHGARPMHPDWARSLRDQCTASGVPFLFKQWGAHRWVAGDRYDEATECWVDDGIVAQRVSKHLAGRELDGRTWDEYPAVLA